MLKPRIKYATVYFKDRRYGGLEEGGWWYNHYTKVSQSIPVWCKNRLPCRFEMKRRLEKLYASLDEGEDIYIEDYPGERETKGKPIYQ